MESSLLSSKLSRDPLNINKNIIFTNSKIKNLNTYFSNSKFKSILNQIKKKRGNKINEYIGNNYIRNSNETFSNTKERLNSRVNEYNQALEKSYEVKFNTNLTYTLIPYYHNEDFDPSKKIFISNKGGKGGYSVVYLTYYDENNQEKKIKTDTIFKLTDYKDNKEDELFGLYFNYMLCKYYFNNDLDKLKYLCILKEFGEVQNQNYLYAYMDNCGKPLNDIINIEIDPINIIKLIKILLKQSLESLKLIHDLDYVHLDIKSDNYLFTINNNDLDTLQIKIIDFGLTKKNNLPELKYFGTAPNLPNDWLINFYSNIETTLTYHHDLFSLGNTILIVIFKLFKDYPIMVCPINYEYTISNIQIIINRIGYNSVIHDDDMSTIYNMFLENGISKDNSLTLFNIFNKLCNPIVSERFESIDDCLVYVDQIVIPEQVNSSLIDEEGV